MSKLDEFTSVFRRAVIPRIEVGEIRIPRLLLLSQGPLGEACEAVAQRVAARFGSHVERAEAESLRQRIDAVQPSAIIAPEDVPLGGGAPRGAPAGVSERLGPPSRGPRNPQGAEGLRGAVARSSRPAATVTTTVMTPI